MSSLFKLSVIPPFRLDYTVWALRRRAKNIVDRWDGKYYIRLFIVDGQPIKITVEQKGSIENPLLFVATDKCINKDVQRKLSQRIKIMLGVTQNLQRFYRVAQHEKYLKSFVTQFIGLKPPRFPSIFEALVNAISCQQISLDAGLEIQNRLTQYIGVRINDKDDVFYAFPIADDISNCSIAELRKIGYSTKKSETIIHLASVIKESKSEFDSLESKSNDEVIKILCQFKGVGRWTAEYVLLRGLGRIEVFPSDDIGAQNSLKKLFHLDEKVNYEKKISIFTKRWHPYAGLVYFHLLLLKLHEKGVL